MIDPADRLYERLPGNLRTHDARHDRLLKRWLAGMTGVHATVDALVDRFAYIPAEDGAGHDTSDLVDPRTADPLWLPWLAQLVGVSLDRTISDTDRRDAIASVQRGLPSGTKAAMAVAARRVLTATRSVAIYDHSTSRGVTTGGPWDVLVLTVDSETRSSPADAIIAAGAKPAGVRLHHATFGATWDTIEARRGPWDQWEPATWQRIEETGLGEN